MRACGGNARFVSVLSVSVPDVLAAVPAPGVGTARLPHMPLQERGRCRRGQEGEKHLRAPLWPGVQHSGGQGALWAGQGTTMVVGPNV